MRVPNGLFHGMEPSFRACKKGINTNRRRKFRKTMAGNTLGEFYDNDLYGHRKTSAIFYFTIFFCKICHCRELYIYPKRVTARVRKTHGRH